MRTKLSLSVIFCSLSGLSIAANAAPGLTYQMKSGSNYVYSVSVKAEEPKWNETVSGTATYVVKKATADGIDLELKSNLRSSRQSKNGGYVRMPSTSYSRAFHAGAFRLAEFGWGSRGPFSQPHRIRIDKFGYLLEESGSDSLPRVLGDLSHLVVIPLPEGDQKKWDSENRCNVILEEKQFLSPASRVYRIKDVKLAATEKTTYEITKKEGDVTTIRRTYELKTRLTSGGNPRVMLVGEGEIQFDHKAGVPTSLKFAGKLTENSENVTVRIPVTVEVKMLTGKALAEALKPPPVTQPVPGYTGKGLEKAELDKLVKDLQSEDKHKKRMAAGKLAISKPTLRQREVSELLVAELQDKDKYYRQNIAKALATWADKGSVGALLKALEDDHFPVRWDAISALGRIQDARAVEPLVGMVKSGKDKQQAAIALKAIGPIAESAVLTLLKSTVIDQRREAAQILKQIGTAKSVAALEKAEKDSDPLVKMFAGQALKEVTKRK